MQEGAENEFLEWILKLSGLWLSGSVEACKAVAFSSGVHLETLRLP